MIFLNLSDIMVESINEKYLVRKSEISKTLQNRKII